jgi:hypothetical protein
MVRRFRASFIAIEEVANFSHCISQLGFGNAKSKVDAGYGRMFHILLIECTELLIAQTVGSLDHVWLPTMATSQRGVPPPFFFFFFFFPLGKT